MVTNTTTTDKCTDAERADVYVQFDGLDYAQNWESVEFEDAWVHLTGWGHTVSVPREKIELVSHSKGGCDE